MNVTGLSIIHAFNILLSATFSIFQRIPESQKTPTLTDFTKFAKSLLIAETIPAKCDHALKNKNIKSIYTGNCNKYTVGAKPATQNTIVTIKVTITWTYNDESDVKVGIVVTGYFIFVTR